MLSLCKYVTAQIFFAKWGFTLLFMLLIFILDNASEAKHIITMPVHCAQCPYVWNCTKYQRKQLNYRTIETTVLTPFRGAFLMVAFFIYFFFCNHTIK
jgi:hypothetical protein